MTIPTIDKSHSNINKSWCGNNISFSLSSTRLFQRNNVSFSSIENRHVRIFHKLPFYLIMFASKKLKSVNKKEIDVIIWYKKLTLPILLSNKNVCVRQLLHRTSYKYTYLCPTLSGSYIICHRKYWQPVNCWSIFSKILEKKCLCLLFSHLFS
jgi:hypothetical protein